MDRINVICTCEKCQALLASELIQLHKQMTKVEDLRDELV
jgi:hypothetical protein